MNEIHHLFEIHASAEKVFEALTKQSELKQWWTDQVQVQGSKGIFAWPSYGWSVEMQVKGLKPGREVVWSCTRSNMQGTDAWVGTTLTFKITPQSPSKCQLDFLQSNYKDSTCYQVCFEGWNYFLGTSLKNYLETGSGSPYHTP